MLPDLLHKLILGQIRHLLQKKITPRRDIPSGPVLLPFVDLAADGFLSKLGAVGFGDAFLGLADVGVLHVAVAERVSVVVGSEGARNNIAKLLKERLELLWAQRIINISSNNCLDFSDPIFKILQNPPNIIKRKRYEPE